MEENLNLNELFALIRDRQINEAEEHLNELTKKMDGSKEAEGIMKALEGLILSLKSGNEKHHYVHQILSSKDTAERAKKEFEEHSTNPLHSPYDRGYFKALKEFVEFIQSNEGP